MVTVHFDPRNLTDRALRMSRDYMAFSGGVLWGPIADQLTGRGAREV
jgi:hypothetical protein